MLWVAVVVLGLTVLAGYAVAGKKLPWRGLAPYKYAWATSALVTVASYGYVLADALLNSRDNVLLLLCVLNGFAAVWGWAYALLESGTRLVDAAATAGVIGTAGAAVAICSVLAHESDDWLVLAAAAALVWQHLIVDGVLWIGITSQASWYSWASLVSAGSALSVGSLLSVASVGSVVSVASIMSINSIGSIGSVNCFNGFFEICA